MSHGILIKAGRSPVLSYEKFYSGKITLTQKANIIAQFNENIGGSTVDDNQ
jgi:hypothetical protein